MAQVIFTPQAIYKYMRNLTVGFDSGASESSVYIKPTITGALTNLKYFVLGTGASAVATTPALTREFYDANCKDGDITGATSNGKGRLASPLQLYATASGYDSTHYKKELTAANFYNYGNTNASKVTGVLSVAANVGDSSWWNMPGIMFQIACHLTQAEGNYDGVNAGGTQWYDGTQTALGVGESVAVNEIGVFDDDDVMILYGTFDAREKNDTLSLKINPVAMLKILDYQLAITESTTTTTTSTTTTTTTTSTTTTTTTTTL